MLDFLVTSKARRRMLQLLWGRGEEGSASQLAERASVGFASAYRELRAMVALGLLVTTREGGAEIYRANHQHPMASVLQSLVATPPRPGANDEDRAVRGRLRALGAPLHDAPVTVPDDALEEAILQGVRLAHRDATVARVLPVCIYRQRERLRSDALRRWALAYGEKPALGFLLDLTASLAADGESRRSLRRWAIPLRDRRRTTTNDFFFRSPRSREATDSAERKAPPCARRWGYRMNMDLESFRSTFERFAHAS